MDEQSGESEEEEVMGEGILCVECLLISSWECRLNIASLLEQRLYV